MSTLVRINHHLACGKPAIITEFIVPRKVASWLQENEVDGMDIEECLRQIDDQWYIEWGDGDDLQSTPVEKYQKRETWMIDYVSTDFKDLNEKAK